MKTQLLLSLFTVVAATQLGCLELQPEKAASTTYDVAAILNDASKTEKDKAEELALIGEALTTPSSFMFADEVLSKALELDATNARAIVFKNINAQPMAMKGAITQLEPIASKFSPYVQSRWQNFMKMVRVNPTVEKFLREGGRPGKSEADAQRLVEALIETQNNVRLFFKNNKELRLTMVLNKPTKALTTVWRDCQATASESIGGIHGKYSISNCSALEKVVVNVDRGDIEALQQIAAGQQIGSIVSVAYDLTGGAVFEKAMRNHKFNDQEGITLVKGLTEFGKVRNATLFKQIHALASDLYGGASWFYRFNEVYCAKRPGKLFSEGQPCIRDNESVEPGTTDTAFRLLASALGGQTVDIFVAQKTVGFSDLDKSADADYRAKANVFAPILNPVADLKSILPDQFDKCGQAINLGDKTVAGLFPNRDGEDVGLALGLVKKECQ